MAHRHGAICLGKHTLGIGARAQRRPGGVNVCAAVLPSRTAPVAGSAGGQVRLSCMHMLNLFCCRVGAASVLCVALAQSLVVRVSNVCVVRVCPRGVQGVSNVCACPFLNVCTVVSLNVCGIQWRKCAQGRGRQRRVWRQRRVLMFDQQWRALQHARLLLCMRNVLMS